MKRFTHDADLRGMVVLRSLGFQLVPFKLHRFRKQRRSPIKSANKNGAIKAPFLFSQSGLILADPVPAAGSGSVVPVN
ncbi:hypothetical protein [Aeromonas salmonicida]|uniref:hypothetical protein n=1 Tax=Aeromonas salmonicida TaxID=645 RepID=UPI0012D9853C|nr:hypothetical protein [Aeromonas salmonicida]